MEPQGSRTSHQHAEPAVPEKTINALLVQKFLCLAFAVIALALSATSVAEISAAPPKLAFLLAVAVLVTAFSIAWLVALPASLLNAHRKGFSIRSTRNAPALFGERWLIPASLISDLLLGVLAFGAAAAAAPDPSSAGGAPYSKVAGSVALMFLTSFSLLAGLLYIAYTELIKDRSF